MAVAAAAFARGQVEFQVGVAGAGFGRGGDGAGGQQRAAEVGVHDHARGVYDPPEMRPGGGAYEPGALRADKLRRKLRRVGHAAGLDVGAQAIKEIVDRVAQKRPWQRGEAGIGGEVGKYRVHGRQ